MQLENSPAELNEGIKAAVLTLVSTGTVMSNDCIQDTILIVCLIQATSRSHDSIIYYVYTLAIKKTWRSTVVGVL